MINGLPGILFGIQGINTRFIGAIGAPIAACSFTLLNPRGIAEHIFKQVAGGGGTPDRPVEPLRNEPGQQSAVVDVRVGQENTIDFTRFETEWLARLSRSSVREP